MIKKTTIIVLFLLGLTYLLWPGPNSIDDFPPLKNSAKSKEPGDTVQTKDLVAYFSQERRKEVTDFYKDQFGYLNILGFSIPPIYTNHPPEEAYTYIRDQQPSTYLEQYQYPLRDALYVNGFEPFDAQGKGYREGATNIYIDGVFYESKTTMRYYGTSVVYRVLFYILSWVSLFWLIKLTKRAISEK